MSISAKNDFRQKNQKNNSRQERFIDLSIYLLIIIVALFIYGYRFPSSNNLVEVPPVFTLLDSELYQKDFFVLESLKKTPRYYYQYLIYFLSQTGFGVARTYFLCYLLSFASFILGLYWLGQKVGRSKLSGSALVFLGLFTVDGTVGYVSLFRNEPIPAIFAMGLAIWGIYFCFDKRWNLGYFLFGLAALLQFLIGILPGILIFPWLAIEAKKAKSIWKAISPLLILVILALIIYLPMVLSGNLGGDAIDNREFIEIYGYLRHPHHIIPSSFPRKEWRNFIGFMLAGIFFIRITDSLRSQDKIKLFSVICITFLALLIGYLFVEIYPLSFVAKLQLARTTPFAKLMVLIGLSVLINEQYRQRNLGVCLLLLVTPIVNNGGTLLLFLAMIWIGLKATNNLTIIQSKLVLVITIIISLLLLFFLIPTESATIAEQIIWKPMFFLILALPFIGEEIFSFSQKFKIIVYSLTSFSLLFLSLGLLKLLPETLSDLVYNKISIVLKESSELDRLALRFREKSSKDALVLTPPSQTEFRFYSQRSVVFNFASFPYTNQGIQEWKNRLAAIAKINLEKVSRDDLDWYYRKRSPTELINIAKQYDADYILTRSDWHRDIKGSLFDREGKWILYKIN
jgi:hypothetical protein